MKRTLLIAAALFIVLTSAAQLPVMVQDINLSGSSNIRNMTAWNGNLYFFANDGIHGVELWKYNETGPATMVYDANPSGSSGSGNFFNQIAVFNNKLYFSAKFNGRNTVCLYNGSGTPIEAPGFSSATFLSEPLELTVAGNKLYFIAQGTTGGNNLWSYDGNTLPHKVDINPGSGTGSLPVFPFAYNGRLYLQAKGAGTPALLYTVDPANDSFNIVTTAAMPTGIKSPDHQIAAGPRMYFFSSHDSAGHELYSYDGSICKRLTDIAPGGLMGAKKPMAYHKGFIYFSGSANGTNFQLFGLEPNTGTTSVVDTINFTGSAEINDMISYKDNIYFTAQHPASGFEVWQSDGINTSLLADIWPGTGSGIINALTNTNNSVFAIFNDHLYLCANDGTHGFELFRLNIPTSIENIKWDGLITLAPNPANGVSKLHITLKSAQTLSVAVTDITGREVFSSGNTGFTTGSNVMHIPSDQFMQGNYCYTVRAHNGALLSSGTFTKQ